MAIFHLSVKIIGRGAGISSVGASAYRSGEKIKSEYDGITHDYTKRRSAVGFSAYRAGESINGHDYTKKKEIVHSEIMLPKNAPREYADRSTLWKSVEKHEKASNARTAREIVIALPNELNQEQNIQLVRDYVRRNFVDSGMCAGFSIHAGHIKTKKNEKYPFEGLTVQQENPHAHIMLTVRPINADGTWGAKSKKEYILDQNGEKLKLPSGNWKSRKIDTTDWDKTSTLEKWRCDWARTVNRNFERFGIDERIDHRSLKAQNIDREPTFHMGHESWNLEKKGIITEKGNINRRIYARNRLKSPERIAENLHKIKENYISIERKIEKLQHISAETEQQIRVSQIKSEEITELINDINATKTRLDELKYKRRSMGIFKNKKDIDRQIQQIERKHKLSSEYFAEKYNITIEESQSEINHLEGVIKRKNDLYMKIQDKLKPLKEEQAKNLYQYQKQRLLIEINPDRERIFSRLEVFEKESKVYKDLVRDDVIHLRCEHQLNAVNERQFQEILRNVEPKQARELTKLRNVERVRAVSRTYERG